MIERQKIYISRKRERENRENNRKLIQNEGER